MYKYLLLNDDGARGLSKGESGYYFVLVCFFVTLFTVRFPVINNMAIGVLFVYTWYSGNWRDKWAIFRSERAVWCMMAFYVFHLLSVLWTSNKGEAGVMLGLRSPLVIFPLSLALTKISSALRERALTAFSVITTAVAVFCLVVGMVNWRHTGDTGFLYNDALGDVLQIQSIYLAMVVNLALFSITWLLMRKGMAGGNRVWLYGCMMVLIPFHFLLASRMAILILYSAAAVFLTLHIFRRRMVLEGFTLVMGVVVIGFLLFKFSPKTFNRFRELGYTSYDFKSKAAESHYNGVLTAEQWNGATIRLAVWNCGREVVKANWLIGTGLGDKMDALMKVYSAKGFSFGVKTKRNLHNNYLDALVALGLVGLLLMALGWLMLPLLNAWKAQNVWGVIVVLSFALSYMSESYFDRSFGCVITGFFICFVVASANKEERITTG